MNILIRKILKVIGWTLGSCVLLLFLLALCIQLPAIQNWIIKSATQYVSNKTHTQVTIERIQISPSHGIVLKGLFAEDEQKDTLICIQEMDVNMNLLAAIRGNLSIDEITLNGVTANIHRRLTDSSFNFSFIVNAFSNKNSAEVKPSESKSSSTMIDLGTFRFSNIRLLYDDSVSGIYSYSHIGYLELEMDKLDLQHLQFNANQLIVKNSFSELILQPQPSSETSSNSLLPHFSLNVLDVSNVHFRMKQPSANTEVDCQIGQLLMKPKTIDLNNQLVEIYKLNLQQSSVSITMDKSHKPIGSTPVSTENNTNDWKVNLDDLALSQNYFTFNDNNIQRQTKGMDYAHLGLNKIQLSANNIHYGPDGSYGKISQFTLSEQSGFELKQFQTQFLFDGNKVELADLNLKTKVSAIGNYLLIDNLDALQKDPGSLIFKLNLTNTSISMSEVISFYPKLAEEDFIQQNANQKVQFNGLITGNVKNIHCSNFIAITGNNTSLAFSGDIKGLPDVTKLSLDIQIQAITSGRADIHSLVPLKYLSQQVEIPEQFLIAGKLDGSMENFSSQLSLQTSNGSLNLVASVKDNQKIPDYALNVVANQFDIGKLFKQPTIGKVSVTAEINGTSFSPYDAVGKATITILECELFKYNYSQAILTANWDRGLFDAQLDLNDSNLKTTIVSKGSFTKKETQIGLNITLKDAQLQPLQLTKESIFASGMLTLNCLFSNAQLKNGSLGIGKVIVVKKDKKYQIDSLLSVSINTKGKKETQQALIGLNYQGETNVLDLYQVMSNYVSSYWGNNIPRKDTIPQGYVCDLVIRDNPFLAEVLFPGVDQFKGLKVHIVYDGADQQLNMDVAMPHLIYNNSIIDSVRFLVVGNHDQIRFNTSMASYSSGMIGIPKTQLSVTLANHQLNYQFQIASGDTGHRLKFAGLINQEGESIRLSIKDGKMILNNELWHLPLDNKIILSDKGVLVEQLFFQNGETFFKIGSQQKQPNAPLKIGFNQFELGTLSAIVEKDSALLRGRLNGEILFESLTTFVFTANLNITDIAYKLLPIGDLAIEGYHREGTKYEATVVLSGKDNAATIKGYFQDQRLDLQLDMERFNMLSIQTFIPKFIVRSNGFISGKMAIKGALNKPNLAGFLDFNEVSFNLIAINNRLTLKNERVNIGSKGITLDQFTILDSLGQPLVVDGSIYTTNFYDMQFALDVKTTQFRLLNTTIKQNPQYYGTIILNSTLQIKGTDQLPIISTNTQLMEGSHFTFVVNESELSMDKGDGVVTFVDTAHVKRNNDQGEQMVSTIKGIVLNAMIQVPRKAKLDIITSKTSGDHLEISGDAMLNFGIDESGKMSLTGEYIIHDGKYKASFQKLVKREFVMKNGGTINWNGDPLNALLNITATYKAKIGATDLLATELAGMPQEARNEYRKLSNYDVNLIMKGLLLKPELSFQLDMPVKDRDAYNGMVYAKVNQINNDPNELNKQVFSVLVLGRFLPVGQSANTSTSEAVSAIARNSVNQLLTDQLNHLSGKYIEGAELNFNLQSNDDYNAQGGSQQNTELQIGLKKELYNNRISVQVGSSIDMTNSNQGGNAQNITGDVLMEYKITEDGSYRFKAFRENNYEGVIDGMLFKTGIGINYSRSYDQLNELFVKPIPSGNDKLKLDSIE